MMLPEGVAGLVADQVCSGALVKTGGRRLKHASYY